MNILNWAQTGLIASMVFALTAPAANAAPRLGEEEVPVGEAASIEAVRAKIIESLEAQHRAQPSAVVQRDAHPKAHGCVKADLTVAPGLSPELRQGIFATERTYKAWIRYSNGSPGDNADSKGDGRGMAVKVLGVQGPKLLTGPRDEKETQDFIMINHPVFFVRNARDYVSFFRNQVLFLGLRFLHEGRIALATANEPITNPFQARYFSMTPYRFGAEASKKAIKYSAVPVPCGATPVDPTPESSDRNFLREAMINTMREGDACFDFKVQFQRDTASMPVEDPTILWDERASTFQTVARIRVPKADNDGKLGPQNEARTKFCEDVSMSPWHSTAEHRPLGGVNRARKTVYQSVSDYRRGKNSVTPFEPTGNETF